MRRRFPVAWCYFCWLSVSRASVVAVLSETTTPNTARSRDSVQGAQRRRPRSSVLLSKVDPVLLHGHSNAMTASKADAGSSIQGTPLAASVHVLPGSASRMPRGGDSTIAKTSPFVEDLWRRAVIGFYFALWYALNVVYNIVNKQVLNVWDAPMTVGSLQLGIGAMYAMMLWTLKLRSRPILEDSGKRAMWNVGIWHSTGQLCTVLSLNAGPVSFTHIVKALEPFFSAIVSALYLGNWMPAPVYASLVPVVGGVGYACLKERSFSWLAFGMAMVSNLAFALRAVLSKVAMTVPKGQPPIGTNLSPTNVFALVTISAFIISIPLAIVGEASCAVAKWSEAIQKKDPGSLILSVLASGLFHYLNNEVMYLALGSVHPVTLAVGNTMKRVVIMVASVMVFQNEITVQATIGSAIGIGGVLVYSLTKQHYQQIEAKKVKTT